MEAPTQTPNDYPELHCPNCHAKLLVGMFVGTIVCRRCKRRITRTLDQLLDWLTGAYEAPTIITET